MEMWRARRIGNRQRKKSGFVARPEGPAKRNFPTSEWHVAGVGPGDGPETAGGGAPCHRICGEVAIASVGVLLTRRQP